MTSELKLEKNNLTVGKPIKKILYFMIPLFIGNLFQQFYSLVDAIIVDRTIGTVAFSGIGITSSLSFLVLGFAQGLTAGLAVITSQYFGAKDNGNVKRSMATSWILCGFLAVALTLLSYFLTKPLLKLMKTPDIYFEYSYDYISVIFLGMGASMFYNMVSYMLRSRGDSKTPLYFLILASVLNIGMDFLFILKFDMGVAGAAWATVFSQIIAGAACLAFMYLKYPQIRLKKSDWKTDFKFCMKHLKIALPMGFQFSIIAIGIMIQQSAINGLSIDIITAYTAAVKVDNIATQAFIALGATMATYCGQNYGAQEFNRLKQGVKAATWFGMGLVVVAASIVIIFGKSLAYVFASGATETQAELCRTYLTFQGLCYPFLLLIYVYRNSLQGMSRGNITVAAGVLELTMRSVAAFILVIFFGFIGVCLSNPIAWIGADVVLLPAYILFTKKMFANSAAGGPFAMKLNTVNRK